MEENKDRWHAILWRNILQVLFWFKRSAEENGKPSGKAISAAAAMGCVIYIVVSSTNKKGVYIDSMFISLLGFICTLYGVKAIGNIFGKDKPTDQTKPPL